MPTRVLRKFALQLRLRVNGGHQVGISMAVIANCLRTRWEAWAEPERAAPDPHQPRTNRMRIWEHSEVWGRIGSRDIKHGHTFTVSVPNGSVFIAATMLGGFLRTHWF